MSRQIVLNIALLERRTGGDEELKKEVAQLFIDESPQLVQQLRRALDADDAVAIEKTAHRLKGSLSTLGAMQAKDTAHLIEEAANRGESREAMRLAFRFEEELENLKTELAKIAPSIVRGE